MEATRSSGKPKKSCKKIDLGGAISLSDSLGAFDEVALATGGGGGSSFDTNSVYSCAFVNVTNASTFKVKFTTSSMGTSSRLVGDSNRNRTSFSFIKLGASQ